MSTKIKQVVFHQALAGPVISNDSTLHLTESSSCISYQSYLTSLDPSKTRTVPQEGMTCYENKSLVDFGHKGTNNQLLPLRKLLSVSQHYIPLRATVVSLSFQTGRRPFSWTILAQRKIHNSSQHCNAVQISS